MHEIAHDYWQAPNTLGIQGCRVPGSSSAYQWYDIKFLAFPSTDHLHCYYCNLKWPPSFCQSQKDHNLKCELQAACTHIDPTPGRTNILEFKNFYYLHVILSSMTSVSIEEKQLHLWFLNKPNLKCILVPVWRSLVRSFILSDKVLDMHLHNWAS